MGTRCDSGWNEESGKREDVEVNVGWNDEEIGEIGEWRKLK